MSTCAYNGLPANPPLPSPPGSVVELAKRIPFRMVLDGIEVEVVPCSQLPFTNSCNFCILKGTACYERRDVTCHSDSRPDGVDVVFRKVQNDKLSGSDKTP